MLDIHEYRIICQNLTTNYCSIEPSKGISILATSLYTHLILLFFSFIAGFLSVIVFIFGKDMNTRFLKYIGLTLILSFIDATINLCGTFFTVFFNTFCIKIDDSKEYFTTPYFSYAVYLYSILCSIHYTFVSILELFIIWERILMFVPSYNFLRKKSLVYITISILVYSICLNMPLNVSRRVFNRIVEVDNKSSITIYWSFDNNDFNTEKILFLFIYICSGIRLMVPLIFEIILNIFLIIRIKMSLNNPHSQRGYKKAARNNSIFSMIVSFISSIFNSFLLACLIFQMNGNRNALILANFGLVFFLELKRYLYFFLLIILNKKFKNNLFIIFKFSNGK